MREMHHEQTADIADQERNGQTIKDVEITTATKWAKECLFFLNTLGSASDVINDAGG